MSTAPDVVDGPRSSGASGSRLRAKSARSRLRFVWGLRSLALFAHLLVFASAWGHGYRIPAVIWLCVAMPLGLSRLWGLFADRPRPAPLVWALELVFTHLIGVLLGLLLLPAAALFALWRGDVTAAPLFGYAIGLSVAGYGVFVRRRWVVVREFEVPCADLPPALDGLRVAHISDLHIGSYDNERVAQRWVARVNRLEPDLIAVTGDLVTSGTWSYPATARVLSELDAKHGAFVILGNHDQWNADQFRQQLAARGVRVLNNASERLRVDRGGGEAQLTVAGLGDPYTQSADMERTLADRADGFTLLLLHYPSWAKEAVGKDVGLALAGHTHGGQVGVPFLSRRFNVARAMGQRSRGLFQLGNMQVHVSAGLGTSGLPIRLGVAPEIVVLRLRSLEAR